MLSFKPDFSLSSFTLTKKLFSFSSLSAMRVVSSAILMLLIFLLAILIPACESSSLKFLMMYSTYWRGKWQTTPVFLPGKSHGQRSLVGCSHHPQWFFEPKKVKSVTVSIVSSSICHEVVGPDVMILVFECWVLSQLFHSPLSPSSRGSLVSLHFLPLRWYHGHI